MVTRLHEEFGMGAKAMPRKTVQLVFTEADMHERNVFMIEADQALKLADEIRTQALSAQGLVITDKLPGDVEGRKNRGVE